MQVLWKPIISCGGKTGQLLQQVPCFSIPISWRGCWAMLLPGIFLWEQVSWQSRAWLQGPLYPDSGIRAVAHSGGTEWLFPYKHFPAGMHGMPSVPLAVQCLPASPPADVHTACADRLVTHSWRQLLRLLVCSLFSTAWKDILILYAYRKCGELSEHLLFINLASYCCIKVINGKTEAQSN